MKEIHFRKVIAAEDTFFIAPLGMRRKPLSRVINAEDTLCANSLSTCKNPPNEVVAAEAALFTALLGTDITLLRVVKDALCANKNSSHK